MLQRALNVPAIDRVWVSDFTELQCRNGKAYAVAIMDLCSRRILGITVSHNMQTRTLIHALNQACHVRRSRPTEPIVFSFGPKRVSTTQMRSELENNPSTLSTERPSGRKTATTTRRWDPSVGSCEDRA
ncbi:MAG: DDE-type integrase/transposase/recombinase [Ignavibacteria bacterium]|nr:DDE-type integrase/transposase/recombinase [Ignavibacteria bacterium]